MTIEEAIRSYLTGSPYPLSVGGRVYSHRAPERPTAPYLVFFRISPEPIQSQTGPAGMIRRTYQFSAYSGIQSEALALGDSVRRLLDGFHGQMGSIYVASVLWQSDRVLYEEDVKLFHFSVDLRFQYYE
jgi:hypothetical protein